MFTAASHTVNQTGGYRLTIGYLLSSSHAQCPAELSSGRKKAAAFVLRMAAQVLQFFQGRQRRSSR
jgi:hypothetical protein